MNRWHALWSTRARPATGFVSQPEPRTIGSFAKGRQLVSGNFLFAGSLKVDQVRSIDKRRVLRLFGRIQEEELESVDDGLSLFLGLDRE